MKKHDRRLTQFALVVCAPVASCAFAQTALLSNGSSNPAVPALAAVASTGNGTPAPGGSGWSEVASAGSLVANAFAGVASNLDVSDASTGLRIADDFVVPAGQSWTLSSLRFYGYVPGNVGTTLPVQRATVRIWQGAPGAAGSVVRFGDSSTNRLQSATATLTYRVFTTTVGPAISSPDTSRRIFEITCSASASLEAGTYWLDVQFESAGGVPLFVVPVTVPGVRTQAGWNALQFADNAWAPVLDSGKPENASDVAQDIAFTLTGTATVACDSIDFNRDSLFPDDADLIDFLSVLAGGACSTGNCSDIDFNNDGLFPDDQDLISFLRVLAGGAC